MIRSSDICFKSAIVNHCEMKIQNLAASMAKPRTTEDFLQFCDVVLSYANYPDAFYADDEDERKIESPLNSIGESMHPSTTSDTSSRSSILDEGDAETGTDEDAWSMVTCWCGKPFAGRPMIECESCLVWLHLSCARVRKSNIPKHFKCGKCKPSKGRRKRVLSETSDMDVSGINSEPSSPTLPLNGGSEKMGSEMDHYQSPSPNSSVSAESEASISNSFSNSPSFKDVRNESFNHLPMTSMSKTPSISITSYFSTDNINRMRLDSKKKTQSRRSAPLPRRSPKLAPGRHALARENDDALAVRLMAGYSDNYVSD